MDTDYIDKRTCTFLQRDQTQTTRLLGKSMCSLYISDVWEH